MELPLFKELQSPIYASVDSLVNNVANRPNQQQTKIFYVLATSDEPKQIWTLVNNVQIWVLICSVLVNHLTNIDDLGYDCATAGGAIAGQGGVNLAEASSSRQRGSEPRIPLARVRVLSAQLKHVASAFAEAPASQTKRAARLPVVLATGR